MATEGALGGDLRCRWGFSVLQMTHFDYYMFFFYYLSIHFLIVYCLDSVLYLLYMEVKLSSVASLGSSSVSWPLDSSTSSIPITLPPFTSAQLHFSTPNYFPVSLLWMLLSFTLIASMYMTDGGLPSEPLSTLHGYLTERYKAFTP